MKKDLYFVVVTFSTSYKTSRFLRVISELDGKKNIYFVNGGMLLDSVQPDILCSITCLHFGV